MYMRSRVESFLENASNFTHTLKRSTKYQIFAVLFGVGGLLPSAASAGPAVEISSPEHEQKFEMSAKVPIQTRFSDIAGSEVKVVEFYLNGNLIYGGKDWSSPFSHSFSPVDPFNAGEKLASGSHTVKVVAKTQSGNALQDRVPIRLAGAATEPAIEISSLETAQEFQIDDSVPVKIQFSNIAAGDVTVVEFYLNGSLIDRGKDWTAPFTSSFSPLDPFNSGNSLAPGSQTVEAVAKTPSGLTLQDDVTIRLAGEASQTDEPAVAIARPESGQTVGGSEKVPITTEVDPNLPTSAVKVVEFRMDGELISGGKDWSFPFARNIQADDLTAGSHAVKVAATLTSSYEGQYADEDQIEIEVSRDSDNEDDGEKETTADNETEDDTTKTAGNFAKCSPDVTWGNGGDFSSSESLQEAVKTLPEDGGTLGIREGAYTIEGEDAWIWRKAPDQSVTICGEGEKSRPTITHTADNDQDWALRVAKLKVINLNLEAFHIHDLGESIADLHYENLEIRDCSGKALTNSSTNSEDHHKDPLRILQITLKNVRIINCGEFTHATYFNSRGCVLRADNIHVEHTGDLEGFRSLCRVNIIKNSYFSNVNDPDANSHDTSFAIPMDFPACGAMILKNNTFVVADAQAFTPRARRSITACDMPNWTAESEGKKFWDSDFWAEVNAMPITDPLNPHAMPIFMSGNSFKYLPVKEDGHAVIINYGTYPRDNAGSFSSTSIYRNVPRDDAATSQDESWTERSVVYSANNTISGSFTKILNGSSNEPRNEQSHPDAIYPPPERKLVQIGGDDFEGETQPDITLPDWWPETCADLESILTGWWDEKLPDNDGFPSCS